MKIFDTSEKKSPANGRRPRDGQKEISDGACLAHDTDLFKAASAIPRNGDGDARRCNRQ